MRQDWPKWKEAVHLKLTCLDRHDVFRHVLQTSVGVKPVGYKWVFVQKHNEKNKVVRYEV